MSFVRDMAPELSVLMFLILMSGVHAADIHSVPIEHTGGVLHADHRI